MKIPLLLISDCFKHEKPEEDKGEEYVNRIERRRAGNENREGRQRDEQQQDVFGRSQ